MGRSRKRRRTFDCGHTGYGQTCHPCQQLQHQAEFTEQQRQVRQRWRDSFKQDQIDLTRLPVYVVRRARYLIAQLDQGVPYRRFQGKLLKACKRQVVSIPIGRRYRMLCRWQESTLKPIAVLSHEDYNGWWQRRRP